MKNYKNILLICLVSCAAPKKINQYHTLPNKNRERVGYWIEKDSDEHGEYVSKGNYKNGVKIGRWKTSYQGKKYHIEKINKKGIAKVKFFHPNGQLMELGKSKSMITETYVSWEKFGDWKYFDDKGKLIEIKKYNQRQ